MVVRSVKSYLFSLNIDPKDFHQTLQTIHMYK